MEWSWRTVLILLGLLGIAVILVDGFRRMKQARAEALRLDIKPSRDIPEEDDFNPELPGKARVVSPSGVSSKGSSTPNKSANKDDAKPYHVTVKRKEPTLGSEQGDQETESEDLLGGAHMSADDSKIAVAPEANNNTAAESKATAATSPVFGDYAPDKKVPSTPVDKKVEASSSSENSIKTKTTQTPLETFHSSSADSVDEIPNSPLIPKVKPVDLNEQVPVLLDVEELGDEASFEEGIISRPRVVKVEKKTAETKTSAQTRVNKQPSEDSSVSDSSDDQHYPLVDDAAESTEKLPEVEDLATINDPHLENEVEQMPEEALISQPVNYAGPRAEVLANRPDAEVVLVIHTIARDPDGFRGKDLLFLFNSCDLRYGEKDIFHRFEDADGEGCIQFSIAQMHNPGTFDPSKMADQRFGGLSFFMSLPGPKKPLEAYEAMSEMAQVVSRNLKADVLDGTHSAMTPQTMEHERQQILDYERQQRLAAKKQRL